ncbi:MAG: serine hydrolase, partial [Candidatus Omnitrophica bacterium]|nr:serine hydrolase [Candidatus Omnitrophota bacterium]
MSKKKIFIIVAVFLVLAATPFLLKKIKSFQQRRVAWRKLERRIKLLQHSFGQEGAIIIKDLSTGSEIAFNADKLFPAASLTKIPIMASYFYASAPKKIDLEKNLILENKFKALGSGILKNYPAGTS